MKVQLPDGTLVEHADDATALDVANGISERLAQQVVAAEVASAAGEWAIYDATRPLAELTAADPVPVKLLTERDEKALGVLRHSCAHVMAQAVMRLFDGVGLAFGPTTATGFYYDFDLATPIREDDFPRIEKEMKEIVGGKHPFERFDLPRDEALELVGGMHQELKTEHINTGLADHETLGFYRQDNFVDLCRGPHIPHTGKIKAFKILSVAGAHWKGNQDGKPLQRVYATAFFDKKAMKAYLAQVEEAKKRDHRVLGKQLGLFHLDPEVGGGLPLWLPKGMRVRQALVRFLEQELEDRGYEQICTPHIGRIDLYKKSGHFPYYSDSQFPVLYSDPAGIVLDRWAKVLRETDAEERPLSTEYELSQAAEALDWERDDNFDLGFEPEEKIGFFDQWHSRHERFLLRPMNCPHHCKIYAAQPKSYRDLPVRLAEFGTVYRWEQSGELNGLLRVRGFTQDDAHIFCTPEQVEHEFRDTLDLVETALGAVGLDDYRVQLSLRDPDSDKYVGTEENWANAEATLRKVLEESGRDFLAEEGEAAFYGPKADFMVRDALGREWQLGTVQLDFNLPERFQLEYVDKDNEKKQPVMIHRAPFGSLERFVGMLIEHFAGAFPLWLAPVQVRVLPLSEKTLDAGRELTAKLKAAGFRAELDESDEKLQAKIRTAQLELIPYMFVIGPQEVEAGTVAVRDRLDGDLGALPLDDAITKLKEEVDAKTVRQVVKSDFAGFDDAGGTGSEY